MHDPLNPPLPPLGDTPFQRAAAGLPLAPTFSEVMDRARRERRAAAAELETPRDPVTAGRFLLAVAGIGLAIDVALMIALVRLLRQMGGAA